MAYRKPRRRKNRPRSRPREAVQPHDELEVVRQRLEETERRLRQHYPDLWEADQRLEQLSNGTDELTGLYNERYLQQKLPIELDFSLRTGIPLGLLAIDIDRIKSINDRYGHRGGDEVVRMVAGLIAERRRSNDVVIRRSGDEFVMLLVNANHRTASKIAAQLQERISAAAILQLEGAPPVTVSIGVAVHPVDATNPIGLLDAAQSANSRAKKDGGNCVRVAGDFNAGI